MDKIKSYFDKMTIRKSMLCTFLVTVSCICVLSAFTIFAANKAQQKLLSLRSFSISMEDVQKNRTTDSWKLTLGENTIQWEPLSQTQNITYFGCYVALIVLPILYVVFGISTASRLYYRLKLKEPIKELQKGIVNIQNNDLDFEISRRSDDELGELCGSMEKMRSELRDKNKRLWELLEQRKLLNASVAHDLRTPITVLNGYLDYLDRYIPQGKLTEQDIMDTVEAMRQAAGRLERYVDCVQGIEKLENIEVQCTMESTDSLIEDMKKNIGLLQTGKNIHFEHHLVSRQIYMDKQLFFRILENLLQNALRYARQRIDIILSEDQFFITLCVKDDGEGFSSSGMEKAVSLFYSEDKEKEHFGIGLSVCQLICQRMGGCLALKNNVNGGACITAKIKK